MTREQYISSREKKEYDYLYDYYKENFDKEKHKPFLNVSDFFMYFQRWPGVHAAIEHVNEYYDAKYSILKVFNSYGEIMMFI